ncbi:hypothetical protein AtNW77_Chr2g0248291 [Arabidopsis thaliana]|jgi:hypothetical protein|uniref:Uncharacterized protein n=4 Tax=Arabidopsis TaxID=3701 RepID=A0A178VQ76_ARATH|nr:TOX high mobility group box protein, putative (DUF1635) [Arabidopsis thaliana]KAG7637795.1 hypothetical protein ISN45_At02g022870 [Arabidopsis thaliana x Arabidopsis arenosa]AAM76761.1 hypothetical protein [Arabidopsis thaliana]AAT69209.1 hypothetical protein At2g28690 [Arabidopsis thaliana]AEC08160.1 TOX high mobility group box protein, putative (DUF1635) [Arabidopsis thaliana]OAP07541.1 hypothetical protein AXX17_AT2G24800 [Arabidopsis thaliana]|eukprot:NP_180437.2 TOX high mobility group box protein, putative (DUF1635) [Arabidopsis thaliana]
MEELGSIWFYQESMDELRQKLQYSSFELEAVKAKANEETKLHQEEVKNLLHLLKLARQERDEAKDQLQKLLTIKTNSSITESNSHGSSPVDSFFEPVSSSEFSNFNMVPEPINQVKFKNRQQLVNRNLKKIDPVDALMDEIIKGKALPEKGKLLQTVMESGPLLQTLLVAGPLPRWRNPPPLQQSFRVPPISNSYGCLPATTTTSMLNFRGCSVPRIATGIEVATKRQRFH